MHTLVNGLYQLHPKIIDSASEVVDLDTDYELKDLWDMSSAIETVTISIPSSYVPSSAATDIDNEAVLNRR